MKRDDAASIAPETPERETIAARWTILGVVAFVLGFTYVTNAWLVAAPAFWRGVHDDRGTYSAEALQLEARLRLMQGRGPRIVLIGSSIAGSNVAPRLLEKRLGLPLGAVLALPLPAASAVESAMLTALIEAMQPDLVVYIASMWTLHRQVEWDLLRFYDPRLAWHLLSSAEIFHDRVAHAYGLLQAAHVVVRHREALRRAVFPSLYGYERGSPSLLTQVNQQRDEVRRRAQRADFSCDSVQIEALRWMAQRLAQKNIRFATAVVSSTPAMEQRMRLRRRVDDCFAQTAAQDGYLSIARGALTISRSERLDGMHFNLHGARKYTEHLAVGLVDIVAPGTQH